MLILCKIDVCYLFYIQSVPRLSGSHFYGFAIGGGLVPLLCGKAKWEHPYVKENQNLQILHEKKEEEKKELY